MKQTLLIFDDTKMLVNLIERWMEKDLSGNSDIVKQKARISADSVSAP